MTGFAPVALSSGAAAGAALGGAVSGSIPGAASGAAAGARSGFEFLSDVRRDFRAAQRAGALDVRARLALARRALAVAEVARGRERYEALRFAAGLDHAGDSPELVLARDQAIERAVREFVDDGDMMGDFVLRVLRQDAHDVAVRERVRGTTNSDAVRAACDLAPIEPLVARVLEGADPTAEERRELLATLRAVGARHAAAKHPLSAKTVGEVCAEQAAIVAGLVLLGEPAPALEGSDLDGAAHALASLRGRVALVAFWGEWSEPCRSLFGRLAALERAHGTSGFSILGVNSDPERATVAAALARERPRWTNLWDGPRGTSGPIATAWRVRAWPEWVLVDRAGIVRRRWRGAPPAEECERAILEALSAAR